MLKCVGLGLRQDPRGLHTGWDEPAVQFGGVQYCLSALPVCGQLVGHLASHNPQQISQSDFALPSREPSKLASFTSMEEVVPAGETVWRPG